MSEPDMGAVLSALTERVAELDRISADNLSAEFVDPVIQKRKRENLLQTVTRAR